jgi:hypothetical protein
MKKNFFFVLLKKMLKHIICRMFVLNTGYRIADLQKIIFINNLKVLEQARE